MIFGTRKKTVAVTVVLVFVALVVGFFVGTWVGISIQKRAMWGSAAAIWMTGVECKKKGAYDYALYNFAQAVALKNDDPLFLHSLAETYELTNNLPMALEFYKDALEQSKKQNTGPKKLLESKVELLEAQLKQERK